MILSKTSSPKNFIIDFGLIVKFICRTIGMFEQNNIGVRCEHPLVKTIASLRALDAAVNPILLAVEAISKFLEGQFTE